MIGNGATKDAVEHKSLAQSLQRMRESRKCCRRASLTAHKMGTVLTNGFFMSMGDDVERHVEITPDAFPADDGADYRHVVTARNLYDSIVSGFLYHRAGHECWLDAMGTPYSDLGKKNRSVHWDRHVERSGYRLPGLPPRNHRSICQYLVDESPEHGMFAYMAWALTRWYGGMVRYAEDVRRREARDGYPRTLFLCLEDAGDPLRQEDVFKRMVNWLFPGDGHSYQFPVRLRSSDANATGYAGGHSTSRVSLPAERKALRDLAQRLDLQVFRNGLGKIQAHYNCGDDQERQQ
jgi:hypothetical protein